MHSLIALALAAATATAPTAPSAASAATEAPGATAVHVAAGADVATGADAATGADGAAETHAAAGADSAAEAHVATESPASGATTGPSGGVDSSAEPGAKPTSAESAPSFGFDRVDLLSEDTGVWLHYDAPVLPANPSASGIRFVEQVKVSLRLPVRGLYAGLSIGSQSLVYEHALLPEQGLFLTGGLQTRLLLPRGVLGGVAWRHGRIRVGASLSVFSQTSWARPNWQQWSVLPTLGFGVGAEHKPTR